MENKACLDMVKHSLLTEGVVDQADLFCALDEDYSLAEQEGGRQLQNLSVNQLANTSDATLFKEKFLINPISSSRKQALMKRTTAQTCTGSTYSKNTVV